ncbi:MAG: hypothetical protein HGB26_00090 [Desulfobulbaceae bacterium]|nr:hypothetical protein [Desulfobulbaceae bacterium]
MKDPNRPEIPRSRVKARSKRTLFFVLAAVVISAVFTFFFIMEKPSGIISIFNEYKYSPSSIQSPATSNDPQEALQAIQSRRTAASLSPSRDQGITPVAQDGSAQSVTEQQNKTLPHDQTDLRKGEMPLTAQSPDQKQGDPYKQLADELNAFYAHLDQQPYMKDFHLKEPSKKHFSKLLQILIDNPPSVTRETDEYFTLLKNTSHFFRVLGKENIIILKGILDREKGSFENILKTFYALTDHPEYLKKEFSLTIPNDNLYDYAGFFLNTIGGRLYLFRRDSVSRMTVSYYAVLIIDKANRKGNSRLGIDLKPSIDSLIEEIENTGKNLKFKEEYLDTLYDLKEIYGNRG